MVELPQGVVVGKYKPFNGKFSYKDNYANFKSYAAAVVSCEEKPTDYSTNLGSFTDNTGKKCWIVVSDQSAKIENVIKQKPYKPVASPTSESTNNEPDLSAKESEKIRGGVTSDKTPSIPATTTKPATPPRQW